MGKPDAADLVRDLASFQIELRRPITAERMQVWIGETVSRQTLLAWTVWGAIRWRKSLGRPLIPLMANAFRVEHKFWQTTMEYTADGGYQSIDLPVTLVVRSKWDVADDDDDYYRVNFTTEAKTGKDHVIAVSFVPGVPWQPPKPFERSSPRVIKPPERGFELSNRWTVLDPFTVVRTSFTK